MAEPVVRFWALDVAGLWPHADGKISAQELALLPPADQRAVLRFHFPRDQRLALGSALLKRAFAVDAGGQWNAVFARRGDAVHGKPCVADGAVDFNVSHQAGLVVLAGVKWQKASEAAAELPGPHTSPTVRVGVDVSSPAERRDRDLATCHEHPLGPAHGFADFVSVHDEVFADADVAAIQDAAPTGSLDDKLRAFYAWWALKEAYIKLTGDALLAPWLKDVEFRRVAVPAPGQTVGTAEVWRGGRRLDVRLWLHGWGPDHFVATAVEFEGHAPPELAVAPVYTQVTVEELVSRATPAD